MNILVYGGKGWIGSQFIALLKKAKLTYHLGASRVDNIESLQKEIKEVLLPLIDDISFEDRVRKCKKMIKPLI